MIIVKGHRVLIKVEKLSAVDEVYKSANAAGIIIAEDHEEHIRAEAGTDRGTVVAVGDDAFKAFYLNSNQTLDGFEPWVVKGDFIAFAKYAGKMVKDPEDGLKYIVINDEDVVAVIKGKQNG